MLRESCTIHQYLTLQHCIAHNDQETNIYIFYNENYVIYKTYSLDREYLKVIPFFNNRTDVYRCHFVIGQKILISLESAQQGHYNFMLLNRSLLLLKVIKISQTLKQILR